MLSLLNILILIEVLILLGGGYLGWRGPGPWAGGVNLLALALFLIILWLGGIVPTT